MIKEHRPIKLNLSSEDLKRISPDAVIRIDRDCTLEQTVVVSPDRVSEIEKHVKSFNNKFDKMEIERKPSVVNHGLVKIKRTDKYIESTEEYKTVEKIREGVKLSINFPKPLAMPYNRDLVLVGFLTTTPKTFEGVYKFFSDLKDNTTVDVSRIFNNVLDSLFEVHQGGLADQHEENVRQEGYTFLDSGCVPREMLDKHVFPIIRDTDEILKTSSKRKYSINCSLCGMFRKRLSVTLFLDRKTQELHFVGSECVKDISQGNIYSIGSLSVERYAKTTINLITGVQKIISEELQVNNMYSRNYIVDCIANYGVDRGYSLRYEDSKKRSFLEVYEKIREGSKLYEYEKDIINSSEYKFFESVLNVEPHNYIEKGRCTNYTDDYVSSREVSKAITDESEKSSFIKGRTLSIEYHLIEQGWQSLKKVSKKYSQKREAITAEGFRAIVSSRSRNTQLHLEIPGSIIDLVGNSWTEHNLEVGQEVYVYSAIISNNRLRSSDNSYSLELRCSSLKYSSNKPKLKQKPKQKPKQKLKPKQPVKFGENNPFVDLL